MARRIITMVLDLDEDGNPVEINRAWYEDEIIMSNGALGTAPKRNVDEATLAGFLPDTARIIAQLVATQDARDAALAGNSAELTAPPASIIVSDRQFFQALAMGGKITEAEAEAAVATGTIPADMAALVDQLPPDQQFTARMLLKGATTFRSDHPLSDMLAGLYGLSEEQKLDLFRVAAEL